MCEVLNLNRSSYYKWKNSAPRRSQRLLDDALVAAEIQAIFDAENGVWGARRITAELNDPHTSRRCYTPCQADQSQKGGPLDAGPEPIRISEQAQGQDHPCATSAARSPPPNHTPAAPPCARAPRYWAQRRQGLAVPRSSHRRPAWRFVPYLQLTGRTQSG